MHPQSMCRPAGWCVYGHIQTLLIRVCCPHMFQDGHHCSCTQEGKGNWTEWLLPQSTHFCHHEVLWETSQRSCKLHLTCHPRTHCNLHTAPIGPQTLPSPSHCTLPYPIWTREIPTVEDGSLQTLRLESLKLVFQTFHKFLVNKL